jgi:predicted PurR-regulated permease PerM
VADAARERSGLALLVSGVVVVAALRLAQDVLMPLALAVLVSFLLAPAVSRIERIGVGRVPAVLLVALLVATLLGGVGWVVGRQVTTLVAELPSYRTNLRQKVASLRVPIGELHRTAEEIEELQEDIAEPPGARQEAPVPKVEMVPPRPDLLETLQGWLGPLLNPLATAGLVAVFALFMLLQREDLRGRLIRVLADGDEQTATRVIDDAAEGVSRYLVTTTLLNAVHGVTVGVGLALLGFPNALLWGLLSMLLRFVPYLGPWMAASLPITLSVAIFDGWTTTLLTVGLFVTIELLSNNVLEPWLYGNSTGLSPFGVILSAVFWAWLWGGVGLLLAIPFTVCLVAVGRHVPSLDFLSQLLGDETGAAVRPGRVVRAGRSRMRA